MKNLQRSEPRRRSMRCVGERALAVTSGRQAFVARLASAVDPIEPKLAAHGGRRLLRIKCEGGLSGLPWRA